MKLTMSQLDRIATRAQSFGCDGVTLEGRETGALVVKYQAGGLSVARDVFNEQLGLFAASPERPAARADYGGE